MAVFRTRFGAVLAALAAFAAALGFVLSAGYSPPVVTAGQRAEALGDTINLPVDMRKAFSHPEDFEPVPQPAPGDWLATHPEYGQTYSAFTRGWYHRPDQVRRKLYFQPIDLAVADKQAYIVRLEKFARLYFGLETAVLPELSLEDVRAGTRINAYTGKRQLRTGDILKALKRNVPADAFCVLGITTEDLYPGASWNFVSGYASYRGRAGVYSFFRYTPEFLGEKYTPASRQKFLLRSEKLLAHEISHMFGLRHCIYYRCIMNGFNHIAEMDTRPLVLCPICLRKLQFAAGFGVEERYAALAGFYREQGAGAEAAWLAARLAKIRR